MRKVSGRFQTRDFWLEEDQSHYAKPHYALEKCARIVNALAQDMNCDLLDVGCGPATLAKLLSQNINYYGIDLAIQSPAPNLLELDITQNKIGFENRAFDVVVMRGVFEYLGGFQREKLSEIPQILHRDGKFVVTYLNFSHLNGRLFDNPIYNNMQPIGDFKRDLDLYFDIDRYFASSHNWYRSEPNREWLVKLQMPLEIRVPLISRLLAVQYFFICSLKGSLRNE